MKKFVKEDKLKDCLRVSKKFWTTGDGDFLGTLSNNVESMIPDGDYLEQAVVRDIIDVCARKKYTLAKTRVAMNFLGYEVIDG